MKKYESPKVTTKSLVNEKNISSLGEWLSGAGADYQEAGVVTYIMLSE